jgi:predicted MarR family transcription regulator
VEYISKNHVTTRKIKILEGVMPDDQPSTSNTISEEVIKEFKLRDLDVQTYEKVRTSGKACKRRDLVKVGDSDKDKKALSYSLQKLVKANLLVTIGETGPTTTYTAVMQSGNTH